MIYCARLCYAYGAFMSAAMLRIRPRQHDIAERKKKGAQKRQFHKQQRVRIERH